MRTASESGRVSEISMFEARGSILRVISGSMSFTVSEGKHSPLDFIDL